MLVGYYLDDNQYARPPSVPPSILFELYLRHVGSDNVGVGMRADDISLFVYHRGSILGSPSFLQPHRWALWDGILR